MLTIDIKDIEHVYVGKAGKCCCGCSGKHRYAKAHVAAASKRRGYKVEADEVNDSFIRKTVATIAQAASSNLMGDGHDVQLHRDFISVDIAGRMYTAYFVRRD